MSSGGESTDTAKRPHNGRLASVPATFREVVRADWFSALSALLALVLVIGVMHPEFLDATQLTNVVQQSVYVALMAAGLAFLIT